MISNVVKMANSHFFKKKFNIFNPSTVSVSKKARIIIQEKLTVNINWDRKMTINNKVPCLVKLEDFAELRCNKFIIYSGCNIRVRKDAKLILKTGYINHNCIIDCSKFIEIGDKVYIGENVIIRDSDNHSILQSNHEMSKEIVIEDNVWIGDNVIILKGVKIGKGSVIGAGSIVTKDIPANCIAVGNPAKIIKDNITWA